MPDTATRAARVTEPQLRPLSQRGCRQLLSRNRVGRLAIAHGARVDIWPLHYVLQGSWIFFRTSVGAKTRMLRHSPWVAFEVDEVDGPFDWRSTVVHGTVYSDQLSAPIPTGWTRGVKRLEELVPGTGTPADPVPWRTVILGLWIDSVEGREARTR